MYNTPLKEILQFAARTLVLHGRGRARLHSLLEISILNLQILTAGTKPSAPVWGGIGDFDVVRTGDCI